MEGAHPGGIRDRVGRGQCGVRFAEEGTLGSWLRGGSLPPNSLNAQGEARDKDVGTPHSQRGDLWVGSGASRLPSLPSRLCSCGTHAIDPWALPLLWVTGTTCQFSQPQTPRLKYEPQSPLPLPSCSFPGVGDIQMGVLRGRIPGSSSACQPFLGDTTLLSPRILFCPSTQGGR